MSDSSPHTASSSTTDASTHNATTHKARVRKQFAGCAEAYIVSPGHADGVLLEGRKAG
jgi:hypothetical protein